jgi:hypothetical protein
MPLIVEDGTGLLDANAYVDIPYVSAYLLGEQLEAWEALGEPEQESAIIRATRYIDSLEFIGRRKTLEQNLSWPRVDVTYDGFEIEGIPAAVKKASAEAVGLFLDGAEFFSDEADRETVAEKIDVIAITYKQSSSFDTKAATKFEVINGLLKGLTKTGNGNSGFGAAKVLRV